MRRPLLVPLLLASFPLAAAPTGSARYANAQLADPAREAAARALMATLRCVVCQGQSIADSDAAMAGDMRALVRERIAGGQSPDAVRRWMVERYGDYVSYDPPFAPATLVLWGAPFALLALGAWIARAAFRWRR